MFDFVRLLFVPKKRSSLWFSALPPLLLVGIGLLGDLFAKPGRDQTQLLLEWLVPRDAALSEKEKPAPVLAVTSSPETFSKWKSSLSLYRTPEFLTAYQNAIRMKPVSSKEFSSAFPDIPARLSGDTIVLHIFSPDGVYLFYLAYRSFELPDYRILDRLEKELSEYYLFKNTGKSKRAPLYWPNQAYISIRYAQSLEWLDALEPSQMSTPERAAYFQLYGLNRRKVSASNP